MKKQIAVLTLLLSSALCYGQDAVLSTNQLIEWNEFYHLEWRDFAGKPTENSAGDAASSVQIKAKPFVVKKKIEYDIAAYFNREKSWARDSSPELLAHERLHFDLAELYARKIRQKVKELSEEGVSDVKVYNLEIQKILEESNAADMQYDMETLHGALDKKQALWASNIKEELSALSRYKKFRRVIKSASE
jgi:hypothetical protein